jgi:hypothetical protein
MNTPRETKTFRIMARPVSRTPVYKDYLYNGLPLQDFYGEVPMDVFEVVDDAHVALAKIEAMVNAALTETEAIGFIRGPEKALAMRRMVCLLEELQEVAVRILRTIELVQGIR